MRLSRSALAVAVMFSLGTVGCASSPTKAGGSASSGDAAQVDTGSGRTVKGCESCASTEFCVASVFSGGPCEETSGSDSGDESCPPGTSFDGECCQSDEVDTTYYCYSTPAGCASPITCECGATAVIAACSGDVLEDVDCSTMSGGLSCQQVHD